MEEAILKAILEQLKLLNEQSGGGDGKGGSSRRSSRRVETASELQRQYPDKTIGEIAADVRRDYVRDVQESRRLIRNLQNINNVERDGLIQSQRDIRLREEKGELHAEELRHYKQLIALGVSLTDIEKKRYENLVLTEKVASSLPDLTSAFFGGAGGADKITSVFSSIGNSIESNLKEKLKETVQSEFPEFLRALRGKEFRTAGIQFSKIMTAIGALATAVLVATIAKLSLELANAEAAFMKTTSASKDMARSLTVVYAEARTFGASIEEVSQSMTSLYTNFHDFTFLNKDTQESLVKTTALLGKMGFSAESSAAAMTILTKNMGMGPAGAEQAMLDMAKAAENLQIPISQLSQDFASQGGALAKLGDEGYRSFMRLEIAAKASGLRVERLMAIVSKFDTFEGAAESAGKLNAALGGNFVNAMDLMMATDPVDRFNQIKDALDNAGLSFDTMGYYQREFIAKSAGLNDAGELALVMKGRYDLLSDSIAGSSQSYEEAAERAKQMASFQEKLNILLASMIPIISPVIDAFVSLGDFFVKYAKEIKIVSGALFLIGGALATITGFGSGAGIASMVAGFMLLADSTEKVQGQTTFLGLTFRLLKAIFKPLLAVIHGIAAGFYYMGEALMGALNSPSVLGAFENFIGVVETVSDGLSYVAYYAGVVLSLMAGVGVALVGAFQAFGALTGGGLISGITTAFSSLGTAITFIAKGLAYVTAMLMGTVGAVNAAGNAFFTKPFNPPSFFLGIIELADAFLSLAEKALGIINPFKAMAVVIKQVGDTFHHILTGVSQFFNLLTSDAAVENVKALAEATNNVSVTKAAALAGVSIATTAGAIAASGANALAGAVNAVTGNTAGGGAGNEMTVNQPVEIKINGDVLEKFIISVVGENVRSIRVTQS